MSARMMTVRRLSHYLQELSRRGFAEDIVTVEIGGAGAVTEVKASPDGVVLITNDVT